MVFNTMWRINSIHPLPRSVNTSRICRDNGLIGKAVLVFSALSLIILTIGCATPTLQPADPQLLFKSDMLSFIRDGVTTREEVVVKLGIPSAQIEGDRILMFQMRADKEGKWHLTAPQWNATTGLRAWATGTCSLVLVFGEDGVLRKHSLVRPQ
jgi:hypothetical protein